MKRNAFFLILSFSVLFLLSFVNQNDLLEKIALYLDRYYKEYPEEKAFIQTDKPFYLPGETIWFKAYLVEANSNLPDSVSVPLYVELIDHLNGTLIKRNIVKLEGGFGHGEFDLNETLTPGIYTLRAYTNWMRNFNEDLFFSKYVKILSSEKNVKTEVVNEDDIDMQFFPEGGDLIEGLESRVAFKTLDAGGNSVNLTGKLISSSGDTLLRFKSEHLGMGSFKFKPQIDKSYSVLVSFRNIYNKTFSLPVPKKHGFTMTMDNVSSKSQIRLAINNNHPGSDVLIIGQAKGTVYYAGRVAAGTPSAFVTVAKEKFPPGIAHFTLFDQNLKALCERIIYIPNTKPLNILINTDKPEYKSREKTSISILVSDQDQNPITGNFLVSVVDETQIKNFSETESLQSNLLLSSDVKGYIENPLYYFDKTNKYAALHLDLLLMTQGWRRFTWDYILQEKIPMPVHFIEKGLIVKGSVLKPNNKPFELPQNVILMVGRDTNQQFLMNTTNADGAFLYYGLEFRDSSELLAQIMKSETNQKFKISIDPQVFPSPPKPTGMLKNVNTEYDKFSEYILNTQNAIQYETQLKLNDAIWLSEMTVQAKKRQKVPDGPKALYSKPDEVIKGDVSPSALNVFDMIRGRVAGVQITGDRSDPKVVVRGNSSISLGGDPLYLLDGAPVTKQTILALNVYSVDRVEVVKSLAKSVVYGDQARGGIISVFLIAGAENVPNVSGESSKNSAVATFQGYFSPRQFYSPKYSKEINQSSIPDLRSTVYWAPMVYNDLNGKATVEYYNTDASSTIRVYVEGLSINGKIGDAFINYKVTK